MKLVECGSCGGLKRVESVRCPHCQILVVPSSRWLRRRLAMVGLGAVAACGPVQGRNLSAGDAGTHDAGNLDADGGPDGSDLFVGVDAYGIGPFVDAGQEDVGADGSFVGMDAYGFPAVRDAGNGDD